MSVIFLLLVTQLDEGWDHGNAPPGLNGPILAQKALIYPLLHELPPRRRGTPTLIKHGFKFMAHL